jgi:hypothetical protein
MTARQQIARLLPLVLLIVLVLAGLRGAVPAPRWTGPLRGYGIAIGIGVEVVFAVLLVMVLSRDRAARRAAEAVPYSDRPDMPQLEPPQALRFLLKYLLGAGMIGVAFGLIANLHLHFLVKPKPLPPQAAHPSGTPKAPPRPGGGGGGGVHIPWGPVLYTLLVLAIVAAVVVSIWWSTRLRRPAEPLVIEDVAGTEELRAAVREGRAALARIDDARAAIIACYVAMERSLADRGTARSAADTPDELLTRAVAAGTVRGGAAGRLTALFYEARFSTHPVSDGQRDTASAALDELAAELSAAAAAEAAAAEAAAAQAAAAAAAQPGPQPPGPGGGRL